MKLKFVVPTLFHTKKAKRKGKITYEVLYVDEFPKDHKQIGESRIWPHGKQILLKKDLGKVEMLKTFIHEMIHIVTLENDVNLTEKQVLALEEALWWTLRFNKWL